MKMKKIIFACILIGLSLIVALNFHIILLDDKVKFLKKAELTLTDTWVDARGANKYKLLLNPALVKAGFKEIIKNAH